MSGRHVGGRDGRGADEPIGRFDRAAHAGRVGFDASHITALADRLEARGLIDRQPDPSDRRVKRLLATPAGVELFRSLRAQIFEAPPTTELSTAEQRALRDALAEALATVKQAKD